jgi:mono/diheme cytochrome c family protein
MARWTLVALFTATFAGVSVDGRQTRPSESAAPAPTAPARKSSGDATQGKRLYAEYSCWACHGYTAQTGNGPRLQPPRLDERPFIAYLRAPRTRQMPAYSTKVMSDREAADIYAFVLSQPREPEVKDVPLLDDLLGEVR